MRFTLSLLGPFEIRPASDTDKQPTLNRKTRAILAYLAASGEKHTRRALADLFCQTAKDPAGSLRWHLSRIRRELDEAILHTPGREVALNPDAVQTDVAPFAETLREAQGQTTPALARAVARYRGPFLEGMALRDAPEFDLWLLGERARCQQLYERGALALVDRHMQQEAYGAAMDVAQQLLQTNALLETVHARLMWLYARAGQRESALAQYEQCRALLEEELAVEPAEELQALHGAVQHNDPLPDVAPQPARQPHQAMAAATGAVFVEREQERRKMERA